MLRPVQELLERLAEDPAFADRYFADPHAVLDTLDLPEEEREALVRLDRDAVGYLGVADALERPLAEEHPRRVPSWITPAIALWGCVAFVLLWLLVGGG